MSDFSMMDVARKPRGTLDRIRRRLVVRAAHRAFNEKRAVRAESVGALFPNIELAVASVQCSAAVTTSLGNMPLHELVLLSSICAYLKPKLVFEFGTYDGLTTLHFAMNGAARILTLDLDPNDPIRKQLNDDTFYTEGIEVASKYTGTPFEPRIEQIFGNSVQYEHRPLTGKVDLIFVDGGHTYELVKSDSLKALEMVSSSGVVIWHDYSYAHPGVAKWLNELSAKASLINLAGTSLVVHSRGK